MTFATCDEDETDVGHMSRVPETGIGKSTNAYILLYVGKKSVALVGGMQLLYPQIFFYLVPGIRRLFTRIAPRAPVPRPTRGMTVRASRSRSTVRASRSRPPAAPAEGGLHFCTMWVGAGCQMGSDDQVLVGAG